MAAVQKLVLVRLWMFLFAFHGKTKAPIRMTLYSSVLYVRKKVQVINGHLELLHEFWKGKMEKKIQKPALVQLWTCILEIKRPNTC